LAVLSELFPQFEEFGLDLAPRFKSLLDGLNLFIFIFQPVVHLGEGVNLGLNCVELVLELLITFEEE